jgi:hypothetical protein
MSSTPTVDPAAVRRAWNDRLEKIVGVAGAVKSVTEWVETASGIEHGFTLAVSTADTGLTVGHLTPVVNALTRDANRRVEIHADPQPGHVQIMVWLDRAPDTWCGARDLIESDGFTVFCDREKFHNGPYTTPPEDGEQVVHTGNPHHAPIPSAFGYGKQGDRYWEVGPLHVIPEHAHGIRAVLDELAKTSLSADEQVERDTAGPVVFDRRRADRQWEQVRSRLGDQLAHMGVAYPDVAADNLMTSAASDIEHDNEVIQSRKVLWEMVDDAHGSAGIALRALDKLVSDGVYDVEYADSDERSEQIKSLIFNARRDLAAAHALMPTDREGDMKP